MAVEERSPDAISAISVKGFKSFVKEQRIEIHPLTLLAGANSSGKSSALQPLLLLKQTLEASYDPGPLLLQGPHVDVTSARQVLSRLNKHAAQEFYINVEINSEVSIRNHFKENALGSFELAYMEVGEKGKKIALREGQGLDEEAIRFLGKGFTKLAEEWQVRRDRCFFTVAPRFVKIDGFGSLVISFTNAIDRCLRSIIHIPGLRGNPARIYKSTSVGSYFVGTFESYVASIIADWQLQPDKAKLEQLEWALEALGLTWGVAAKPMGAIHVELLVERLARRGSRVASDLVNIADVGFGVSQVLPVLVALLTAKPGQLVYLEQPELHLHPRAEQALSSILADAANRGVQVVAETHSSILLRAIQTLVAEGKLPPDKVKLHWFQRDSRGATQITSGELDELGAFGDWPVDFDVVEANVDNAYLDAVETRAFQPKKKHARK